MAGSHLNFVRQANSAQIRTTRGFKELLGLLSEFNQRSHPKKHKDLL